MNGAGMVKDLRAAMSQGGAQAAQLREAVAAFATATTRAEQLALIDILLKDWAQTSDHFKTLEGYLIGAVNLYPPGGMSAEHYRNVVGVLEAFNGARFYSPIGGRMPAGHPSRTTRPHRHPAQGLGADQRSLQNPGGLPHRRGDQIILRNWFYDLEGKYRIERLEFADGTVWSHATLAQLALATSNTGTAGDDTLGGTAFYSERLIGGEGRCR